MLLCCGALKPCFPVKCGSRRHWTIKEVTVRNLHSSSETSLGANWVASAVFSSSEASTPADGLQTSTTSVLLGRTTLSEKILWQEEKLALQSGWFIREEKRDNRGNNGEPTWRWVASRWRQGRAHPAPAIPLRSRPPPGSRGSSASRRPPAASRSAAAAPPAPSGGTSASSFHTAAAQRRKSSRKDKLFRRASNFFVFAVMLYVNVSSWMSFLRQV